jgi:hypothetical protein
MDDFLRDLKEFFVALARAFAGLLAAVKLVRGGKDRLDALMRAYRARKLQKRVEAAPLREKMSTSDGKLTYVKVRPTTGDTLPQKVVDDLESYIAGLPRKEIHRKLKVEYRDGQWGPVGRGEN